MRRKRSTLATLTILSDAVNRTCQPVWGLIGPDRAMLYLLAAWTGFRRSELGSLTLRNFTGLESESNTVSMSNRDETARFPTVSVEAAYSKHRRDDVIALHPDIVERFKKWVEFKKPKPDEILFPISNLCRANVSPKVAQTLARHSDVRLTLEIYSHITDDEQIDAINALPGLNGDKEKKAG